MHPLSFALKRAHHATLATARYAANLFDLTPARFDLLYVIHRRPVPTSKQSYLARALGVTGMTVSRMVRRLEELGLVKRSRHHADRRARTVELTADGLKRIRRAIRVIMTWGYFHLALESFFGFGKEGAFFEMDDLYWRLRSLAEDFGDRSTLHYPTCHPDD